MKQQWRPGTMLYPVPAALISCGDSSHSNLVTVAWTGTVCSDPAMLYISLRPSRLSYQMIMANMQFTVNLTTEDMAEATDWCGVRSGRDYDKWQHTGLTPEPGVTVECPSVAQSPLSIECKVCQVISLGSHDMFIAKVTAVLADEKYIDADTGRFDLNASRLMAWCHGAYYSLGDYIGHFGFSVKKKS